MFNYSKILSMKIITIPKFLIFLFYTGLTLATGAQSENSNSDGRIAGFYSDNDEVKKSVADISEMIKDNGAVLTRLQSSTPTNKVYRVWGTEKNIRVLENRIELIKENEKAILYFKDFINDFTTIDYSGNISIYFGNFSVAAKGKEASQKLRDEFLLLREKNKNVLNEDRKSQLDLFEKTASEYRALKVKPPISEEQRKYIVQANAFNEKRMYNEAIRSYEQAIALDQTAYPAAYSNLALLSAQVKQYDNAIYQMKKYLLLAPDATDARGAQDKIYEWEAEIAR